jgi:hypothetical protein
VQLSAPAKASLPCRELAVASCKLVYSPAFMQPQDVERIAKAALRELGAGEPPLTITADSQPDRWLVTIGGRDPSTLVVRAGKGTTANHIREQIFTQFSGR